MPKITEDTINSYLSEIFKESGFEQLPQMYLAGGNQPDHLLEYKGIRIISETKIGESGKELEESLGQLTKYNAELKWNNIMAIIFPDVVRKAVSIEQSREAVRDIMRQTKVNVFYSIKGKSTNIYNRGNIFDFLRELRKIIESTFEKPQVDFNLLVKVLRELTEEFSLALRNIQIGDQVYKTPVGSFELFTAIAEKDEDTLGTSAVDLVAYIFVNQLLFYKLFADKHPELPHLRPIEDIAEVKIYYNKIMDIDFKAIYAVDVLSILPEDSVVIGEINRMIQLINNLPFSDVEHDILGRFFHDLLPFNTRKLLAAFYTRPQSAEILSTLAIDRYDEVVCDPACGSGTLLVSAYRRKARLSGKPTSEVHEKFVEEDILGIDIMPFAIHLTALNLTMQDIESITDYTQTAIGDSLLELPVGSIRKTQNVLPGFLDAMIHQSLDSAEKDKLISIPANSFDVVIMNPPFTKTERLPKSYSKQIKKNWKEWGGGVGMWGSFIGLACDYLAKHKGGKVAAVIPIAIFRGTESKAIREKIFSDKCPFRIKYVVKALANLAFSESSAFRDILLVLESDKKIGKTGFVFIKKDITELSVEEARELGERIKAIPEGNNFEDDDFMLDWIEWKRLVQEKKNLMPYVNIVKKNNRQVLFDFFKLIESHEQFKNADKKLIREGWGPRPRGINKIVIVTRPTHPSRIKNAHLILEEDAPEKGFIKIRIKNTDFTFEIPFFSVVPSLRTATGIRKMFLKQEDMDYIITKPFDGFDFIKQLSGVKWEMDWEKLNRELEKAKTKAVMTRRINYGSVNTHFCSLYTEKTFFITNQLKTIDSEYPKYQALVFNSILTLSQIFSNKEDTEGNYADIHGHDIECLFLPVFDTLSELQKSKFNDILLQLRDKEFPSLFEQLNTVHPLRLKLDRELFEIFGIDFPIKKLYRAVAEEIERNVGVK